MPTAQIEGGGKVPARSAEEAGLLRPHRARASPQLSPRCRPPAPVAPASVAGLAQGGARRQAHGYRRDQGQGQSSPCSRRRGGRCTTPSRPRRRAPTPRAPRRSRKGVPRALASASSRARAAPLASPILPRARSPPAGGGVCLRTRDALKPSAISVSAASRHARMSLHLGVRARETVRGWHMRGRAPDRRCAMRCAGEQDESSSGPTVAGDAAGTACARSPPAV